MCWAKPALLTPAVHAHAPAVPADAAAQAISTFLADYERALGERQAAGEAGAEEGEAAHRADDAPSGSGSEGEEGGAGRKQRRSSGKGGRKAAKAAAAPDAAPPRRRLSSPFLPLRWLQRLGDALSHARCAGAMPRVDATLLVSLLAALEGHVELGLDRVVGDDDGVRGERGAGLGPQRACVCGTHPLVQACEPAQPAALRHRPRH